MERKDLELLQRTWATWVAVKGLDTASFITCPSLSIPFHLFRATKKSNWYHGVTRLLHSPERAAAATRATTPSQDPLLRICVIKGTLGSGSVLHTNLLTLQAGPGLPDPSIPILAASLMHIPPQSTAVAPAYSAISPNLAHTHYLGPGFSGLPRLIFSIPCTQG